MTQSPDTQAPGSRAAPDPQVSVIVISYNTRQMTLDCLASVARETTVPHEVIVVDNASTDGSAGAIADAFPDMRLIAEETNHGFARAHDVAIPHARAPFVLLLNPDTVVLDRAIDRIMDFAERCPDAGIWGGRTVFADGTLNPYSCWRQQSLWSIFCAVTGLSRAAPGSALFNPEAYGGWNRDTERGVDIVTGCFLLIRRAFWDRLDGFEPAFFMYGEEADLCLRAQALGAAPRITPEATIIHHGGASETVRADKMVRIMRAKTELVLRHFGTGTKRAGAGLLAGWPLSRVLLLGAAARLTGRQDLDARAAVWREVWARRAEWRNGYSDA